MSLIRKLLRKPVNTLGNVVAQQLITNPMRKKGGGFASPLRLVEEGMIQTSFPIDIVYTWVDQDDPEFQETLGCYRGTENRNTSSAARFQSHDELKYSLRSIEEYAPWYNHIYIVTNGQVPSWLNENDNISIIHHNQILDREYLPTFNSHVIGSALHKIPGLSENYIYFNDDVLLLRPIARRDAFSDGGLNYAFITNVRIGNGPPVSYETATEWGAKNARDLIYSKWGYSFDRRFTHMYHPQRKSVAEECESAFRDTYHAFRRNRFREMNDILCCSFLHHYVGYVSGKTMFTNSHGHFVRIRNHDAELKYNKLLSEKSIKSGRSVVCLNDYIPRDGGDPDYLEKLLGFLESYYPHPSSFERDLAPVQISRERSKEKTAA